MKKTCDLLNRKQQKRKIQYSVLVTWSITIYFLDEMWISALKYLRYPQNCPGRCFIQNCSPQPDTCSLFQKFQNGEDTTEDEEQFLNAMRSSIEIFVNRMKSNSMRGRSIANDSSVQSLFMTINAMHPQLLKHMEKQEEQRGKGGVGRGCIGTKS